MKIALDTNVMAYAEAVNGLERQEQARDVLARRLADDIVIPVQALAELYGVLVRKAAETPHAAAQRVGRWIALYDAIETTTAVLDGAMTLVAVHRIGLWDAIVLASAAAADCRLLLTEDMQDGFTWRGVTVRNPFAT